MKAYRPHLKQRGRNYPSYSVFTGSMAEIDGINVTIFGKILNEDSPVCFLFLLINLVYELICSYSCSGGDYYSPKPSF